jgi:hypothetical protein
MTDASQTMARRSAARMARRGLAEGTRRKYAEDEVLGPYAV